MIAIDALCGVRLNMRLTFLSIRICSAFENLEVSEFLGGEPKGGAGGGGGATCDQNIRRWAARFKRTITHAFIPTNICKTR